MSDLFYTHCRCRKLVLHCITFNEIHIHTHTHTILVGSLDEGSALLPDNTQHSQERDIHAPGGIRTRNPSKRAAADPLRPRGYWDRQGKGHAVKCTNRPSRLAQTVILLAGRCPIRISTGTDTEFIGFVYLLQQNIRFSTVELHLSGLIGSSSHPDMQKFWIIRFFKKIDYIDSLMVGCFYL